ncbi:MAG: TonB-dependent receptor [Flavobacteriaceae bacterium]
MKQQQLRVGVAALCMLCVNLSAQEKKDKREKLDEIVVSATKFESKKQNTGKVIYKITQKDILNNAGKTVLDLLNTVPGIEIKGVNTNPSEPRSTFVRGGRSRQVLILIDGVPVSDPSGINQEYDLRLLSLSQIESIEILKGASSTLYGTGAATGVINIRLKKSSKKAFKLALETSLGTNNTADLNSSGLLDKNVNLSINGSLGDFNYLASYNLIGLDGMSAAKSNTAAVFESDLYASGNGLFKLGYKVNDQIALEGFLNFDKFEYDFDAGNYADSPTNMGNQKQLRVGFKPKFSYASGEFYALATFNKVERTTTTTSEFLFEGRSINIDFVNKYNFLNDTFQLITGFNFQEHSNNTVSPFGNIDRNLAKYNTRDPYASLVYISDFGLSATVGGRLNMHSLYGNHFVYDGNVSYKVLKEGDVKLRLLSSYSTAFIAPSTYQLFSDFGNTDLNPETSKTIEFGFNANYKKWLDFNVVYFDRTEQDAFIFESLSAPPFGIYANSIDELKVNGIESEIVVKPINNIRLLIGYTYINKEQDIDYIPENKLVASLELNVIKNTFVSLVYKNTSERLARYFDANTFTTVSVDLPSYQLLDVNINHKLMEGDLTLFGSVTNILNEDYEDVLGYSTRGRNFKLGMRLRL